MAAVRWMLQQSAGLDSFDDARRQLLGTPRTVDQLQTLISEWAIMQGVDITPYQVEARFRAFGSLPIIVAVFTDSPDSGFLLIDGVTGALDGPFAPGSAINPLALLAGHAGAYEPGMEVEVIESATGCAPIAAKKWRDEPPSPGIWVPAPPAPGAPANTPKSFPGWWQPWSCTPVVGGTCKCESTGEDGDSTLPAPVPARPNTPVKILCTGCTQPSPGECATPAPAAPATPVPHPVPPAAPQTPAPGAGCTCKKQWFY